MMPTEIFLAWYDNRMRESLETNQSWMMDYAVLTKAWKEHSQLAEALDANS